MHCQQVRKRGTAELGAGRDLDLLHMMAPALSGKDTGDLDSHTGPQAMFGLFPFPGSFLGGLVLEQDSKQDDRWALEPLSLPHSSPSSYVSFLEQGAKGSTSNGPQGTKTSQTKAQVSKKPLQI